MALEKSSCGDLNRPDEQESSDWSNLPEDLKVEILCLLPEKSLIAFKRVSKDWYLLISCACIPRLSPPSPSAPICGVFGPSFTCDPSKSSIVEFSAFGRYQGFYGHRRMHHIPDTVGSYLDSLPFTCTTKDLLDCCNGLLLISHSDCSPTQYIVGNPAIRETILIPVNPKHQNSNLVDCSLVFDPTESLDYKIIRFVHSIGKLTIRLLDIFCSKKGKWIEYKLPLEPVVCGLGSLKSSVYLDGVLYKISNTGCLICIALRSNNDIRNLNAWTTVELPNHTKENVGSIGTSRGHLYYFCRDASYFLVWTLDHDAQWLLNRSISIYSLVHSSLGGYYCKALGDKVWSTIQPCVLLPSLDQILIETPWFLVTYDLKEDKFIWYNAELRGSTARKLGQSFAYSRSLVVLNGSPALLRMRSIYNHSLSSSAVNSFQLS